MRVGRDLRTAYDTLANVEGKVSRPARIAPAYEIRNAELCVSIQSNPSPSIAPTSGFLLWRCVLRFRSDELPDFVTLNSAGAKAANLAMVIRSTSAAHVLK